MAKRGARRWRSGGSIAARGQSPGVFSPDLPSLPGRAKGGIEGTEKTAVFLYSKVKELPSSALPFGGPLGLMLHYNVIFPRHTVAATWAAQRLRKWDA